MNNLGHLGSAFYFSFLLFRFVYTVLFIGFLLMKRRGRLNDQNVLVWNNNMFLITGLCVSTIVFDAQSSLPRSKDIANTIQWRIKMPHPRRQSLDTQIHEVSKGLTESETLISFVQWQVLRVWFVCNFRTASQNNLTSADIPLIMFYQCCCTAGSEFMHSFSQDTTKNT